MATAARRSTPGGTARASKRAHRVVVFSGHMTDLPDRPLSRFPPEREQVVREELADTLDRWAIGRRDLCVCGGARGGDILFAELCLERGARVHLFIALPLIDFLRHSVHGAEGDWEQRLYRLLEQCEVSYLHKRFGPATDAPSAFAQNNQWMLAAASAAAPEGQLYALLLWDERTVGDGPGGTADFARSVAHLGEHTVIVNPLAREGTQTGGSR